MRGEQSDLEEHEVHLRNLWRDMAESGIEHGIDWPGIVRTLFRDIDLLTQRCEAAEAEAMNGPCHHDSGVATHSDWQLGEELPRAGDVIDTFRCELRAGHAGAHQVDRGRYGTALWPNEDDRG